MTEESPRSLDRSLVSGIAWTVTLRWLAKAVSWAATLYVARVLSPADFGVVAMATVPIGLARLMGDFGLEAILVQNRTLAQTQLAALASTALVLAGALATLFIVLARPISWYFREPAVAGIVVVLSLTFVTDALQLLPRALLQRDLRFQTLAWLNGLQAVIGALVLAGLAALSFGYWALALNTVVTAVATTAILYALRPFRLGWPRQLGSLGAPLAAGWRMIVSRGAWYGYTSLDSTLAGRMLGKDSLGVYGFAMSFASLPETEVSSMVSRVVPGVFSAVQDNPSELRRYFLLLTEGISYLTLPMSLGLALTAEDFILAALGPKWTSVIVPLQILCVYVAVNTCQMLLSHILLWTGRFRAYMWVNIASLLLLPACFYVGLSWGVPGLAVAWVIAFPLSIVPRVVLVSRILDLSAVDYIAVLRPAFIACAVMAVAVLLTEWSLPDLLPHAARLGLEAAAGAVVYAVALLGLFGARIARIWTVIRQARRA
jgi:O-antigen/teichoic acid export membrane protein